ncbi:hypothetical protein SAMN05216202_2347 [Pseudomonas mucidolens]|uniref:Uncharacterized protein n=1 Tax=Pseudomonas mucidolens TaxID=46679 RepID=A0A1H2MTC2_9PSED|nr:hypothetical protein SAMN05216202_2347 [Pseudomonas mucidolens]SQH33260.1 Uncharacterised protein [Pseudomonas mucidolens]
MAVNSRKKWLCPLTHIRATLGSFLPLVRVYGKSGNSSIISG